MKKILFLLISSIVICGCNCGNCNDNSSNNIPLEAEFIPDNAKFISSYPAKKSRSMDAWISWELDGQCFLSYNLNGQTGLLTKIDCPDSIKGD